jgi:dephospho-CoA kinase
MPAIAITGAIGSGKTCILDSLQNHLGAERFCADEMNRRLLDEDVEIKRLITLNFGDSYYLSDGSSDRKKIFELIRQDQSKRTLLEGILHPRLEQLWKPLAASYRGTPNSFFLAEIPLLYEKHLEHFFDKVIVVASSDSIRKKRLLEYRRLSPDEAEAWSTMQEPQMSKISKADHVIWNDGSLEILQQQIQFLASQLLHT